MAYIDLQKINLIKDGERADQNTLNRPLLELIDILNYVLDDVSEQSLIDPKTHQVITTVQGVLKTLNYQYDNEDIISSLHNIDTGVDSHGKPVKLDVYLNQLFNELDSVLKLKDKDGNDILLQEYLERIVIAQEDLNLAIGELDEFRDKEGNHITLAQYIDMVIRDAFGDISDIEGEDGNPISIEGYIRKVVEETVGDMSQMVDHEGNPISISDYIDLRIQDINDSVVLRIEPRRPTELSIQLLENDVVEVDTSQNGRTLILPNTNKLGTTVLLIDIKGTWDQTPPILKGNGKNIMRLKEDMKLNVSNITIKFVLTSQGWIIES